MRFEKRYSQGQSASKHQLRCLWGARWPEGTVMSYAVLPCSALTSNPTGACAKGHYQLMAFHSSEVAGSSFQSFPVWVVLIVLGPSGVIQQKVLEHLEVLRGWHGIGGWFRWEWNPEIKKILWAETQTGFALSFQSGKLDLLIPLACPAYFYFLPRMKTNIYLWMHNNVWSCIMGEKTSF